MRNPIGPKQRELIGGIKRGLSELVGYLAKCKQCKIPIDDIEEASAFLFDRIQAIETEFIGAKPSRAIDQSEQSANAT